MLLRTVTPEQEVAAMSPIKKLNNKGYTLIELIVTILMTAIVAAIISMFISVSRTSYDEVKKEAVLQEEAQMAGSYIGDIAIEASECTFISSLVIDHNNYKVLTIKAPDPEYTSGTLKHYYFIILWEENTQTLRFDKVEDTGTPPDYATVLPSIISNPRSLLARYVTDMQVVTPDASTGNKLTKITLIFKYRDEEYVLTKNITGRNFD